MRGTLTTLIADLLRKPACSFREELLAKARSGFYHDYKSPEPTPKILLVTDLARYGYRDLARKAARGEYNDEPDAEDNAEHEQDLKEPWLKELWSELQKCMSPEEAMAVASKYLTPEEARLAAIECGFPVPK